ncbi:MULTISPECIES: M50 family metallopeptidase [unclassified Roseovarius]|uniref:M50 family metallopeptidase n=1 Tax=unclassified Roseovarius TaxID=2614913 RepID=UPI00273DD04A|nr:MULTISPECIES: M50 family metallopeptidase [unclassified Roseovarius]
MRRLARGHWQLGLLTLLIVLFWPTWVVAPLKVLIVFLHEISHAIATLLTGGSVLGLTIDPMQGGMVISRGGNRFLILTAGYMGSLLIGALLMIAAVRTHWDRIVLGGLGLVLLAVTGLYVRDFFAIGFGMVTGLLMLGVARFLPRDVNDLTLRVIGLTSMIYVPLDIYSDTIARSHLLSDARMLADEFGGTATLWGWAWLIISLAVIVLTLRRGLGRDSNIRLRGR